MIQPSFWRNRRVLLTGHTGFKGGWAAVWLHRMGAKVSGFALPPDTVPNFFSLAGVADLLDHRIGDIRNRDAVAAALRECEPEIVFHMAAQPLVRRSYAQPLETFATNIMGTAHLLEAVRRYPGVRAAIIVTSDKCYANDESGRAFREADAMGGNDPYSSSKGAAELVTAAYARSYFPSGGIASARAGNVIGGGDWSEDRLVPDIIRSLQAGRPIALRHPQAVRPWQHVLEPLAGYLLLAQQVAQGGDVSGGWNFGPPADDMKPVAELARVACSCWGKSGTFLPAGLPSPKREAGMLVLDSAKARERLGWRPRWNLEGAVAKTMDWYRAHFEGADMRAHTLTQIDAYEHS